MPTAVIIGATSAIAQAAARILAQRSYSLFLLARDASKLEAVAADLRVRGADHVSYSAADLSKIEDHPALLERAVQDLGGEIDAALIFHGVLGDQKKAEQDFTHAHEILHVNFISPVSLLTILANRFRNQGKGKIVVVSSVAGDRGRQSNYVYGASKAALDAWLSGLRQSLYPHHVSVLTVKPGFVDTPMTAHLDKNLLFASPESIAKGIVSAMDGGRSIVYLPWFWRPIMLIIRNVPEFLFKRLKM